MAVRTAGRVGYGGRDLNSLTFEPKQYISNSASDRVVAGNGPNQLFGNNGNDTLVAKDGDDELSGGNGRDTLFGGKDADYFIFDKAPSKTNIDRVMDFSRKQGDKLAFSYKYFKAVDLVLKNDVFGNPQEDNRLDLKVGYLSKKQFRIGEKAMLETDRIIYNKATGALYYDADGSGAGEAVKIADFKRGTTLTHTDFMFF